MPVTNILLDNIDDLFRRLGSIPAADQGDFLAKNRKKIKIVVETMSEQLVEAYFGTKPKNAATAVLLINGNIDTLEDASDAALFQSLLAVLEHYDVLADKKYIDHKPELEPLVRNEIRRLCMNLALHRQLTSNPHAAKLRMLLHEGK